MATVVMPGLDDEAVAEAYNLTYPTVCASPVCERPVYTAKMCRSHYRRWQRTKDAKLHVPIALSTSKGSICRQAGCQRVTKAFRLCKSHYNNARIRAINWASDQKELARERSLLRSRQALVKKSSSSACRVAQCSVQVKGRRELCNKHYSRYYRWLASQTP